MKIKMKRRRDRGPYYIYTIAFIPTGKIAYVGQTNDPTRRWKQHKKAASGGGYRGENTLIASAIRKYGVAKFRFDVSKRIYSTQQKIDAAERRWIKKHKTLRPNGYNLSEGGRRADAVAASRIAGGKGGTACFTRRMGAFAIPIVRKRAIGRRVGRAMFRAKKGIHSPDFDRSPRARLNGRKAIITHRRLGVGVVSMTHDAIVSAAIKGGRACAVAHPKPAYVMKALGVMAACRRWGYRPTPEQRKLIARCREWQKRNLA